MGKDLVKSSSIKNRQILFTLCTTLIPITIITSAFYFFAAHNLKQQRFEELKALAESKRVHVNDLMETLRIRTADLNTDGYIRNNFEKIVYKRTRGEHAANRLNKYLAKAKLPLYKNLLAIALVDKSGNVVSSSSEKLLKKDLSKLSKTLEIINKDFGKTSTGMIKYFSDLDANCVLILTPITDIHKKETLGVLICYYDIAVFEKIVTNRIGLGETGETYIVDRNKKLLTESRFIKDAQLKLVVDTPPLRKILEENEELVGIYRDYRNVPVVGVSAYIPEYGLIILAEIDKSEVFAPINTLGFVAIVLCAAVGICSIVIGLVYANSITRPIIELKHAIEKFKEGNRKLRVKALRNDEVGSLVCSYNLMAEELEQETIKTEQTQKQLQEFFHTVKQCSSMVIITDRDGNIEFVNPMFSQITGYSSEEVLGKNPRILKSGKTPLKVYKKLWETITSGDIYKGEILNRKKNGELFWESISVSSVKDGDGNIYRFIKISDDISMQMQLKRRLDAQHAVICALTESKTLKDASQKIMSTLCECFEWDMCNIWVYDLKYNELRCVDTWTISWHKFSEFEAMTKQIALKPNVGLPGRVWSSANPLWIADVVPDINFPRSEIARKEGLHAAVGFPIQIDKEIYGAMEFFSHEIRQPDNDLLKMMSTITQQIGQFIKQRQAEELLREKETLFRQMAENIEEVFWVTSPDCTQIYYISPAYERIWGRSCESMYENPLSWTDHIHASDRDKVIPVLSKVCGELDIEYRIVRPDGSIRWIHDQGFPVRDMMGKTVRMVGIAEDITKEKEIELSLEQRVNVRTKELEMLGKTLEKQIVGLKHAEEETNKKISDLTNLINFSNDMLNEINEDSIISCMSMCLKEHFKPDVLTVMVLDTEKHVIDIPAFRTDLSVSLREYIKNNVFLDPYVCRVMRTGHEFIVKDIAKEASCDCLAYKYETGCFMCIPLLIGGITSGVVHLAKKEKESQDKEAIYKLANAYITQATNAIHRIRLANIMKQLSIIDSLTKVYNRRFFDDLIMKYTAMAKRNNETMSLLLVDIDHFKNFNDNHGHTCGDRILQLVATNIRNSLREMDVICRYGGEEFAIILPTTNLSAAVNKADKIRRGIESLNLSDVVKDQNQKLTISIGAAALPEHGLECDSVITAADRALYKAKNNGRNRVETP